MCVAGIVAKATAERRPKHLARLEATSVRLSASLGPSHSYFITPYELLLTHLHDCQLFPQRRAKGKLRTPSDVLAGVPVGPFSTQSEQKATNNNLGRLHGSDGMALKPRTLSLHLHSIAKL